MRKTIDFATTERLTAMSLPNEIAGQCTAVFGIRGAGKSNTATVIVEGLVQNGEQVVMVDPKGEGWGLLHNRDGRPSNLDVIVFGEPNGHINALDETHGSKIAEFVVSSGRSIVLSLLAFPNDSSERRFVTDFMKTLYRLKSRQSRKTRTLVVIDEAHLFVPESSGRGQGEHASLVSSIQRIVRQGRAFGLGALIIDQRPQDVAKRILSQCCPIVCHRLTHNLDRKAIDEWMRGFGIDERGKEMIDSLASLSDGEAWFWHPLQGQYERIQVKRRQTLDTGSGASDGPSRVERAEIDLDALAGELEEIVENQKANDPSNLKKNLAAANAKISELEKAVQIANDNANRIDEMELRSQVDSAVRTAQEDIKSSFRPIFESFSSSAERIKSIIRGAVEENDSLVRSLNSMSILISAPSAKTFADTPKQMGRRGGAGAVKPGSSNPAPQAASVKRGDSSFGGGALRMITELAGRHPAGFTEAQWATMSRLKRTGGTWSTYKSRLVTAGLVEQGGDGLWRATAAAVAEYGGSTPSTPSERIDAWKGRLGGGASRMIDALLKHGSMSRDDLGAAVGISTSGGTFGTYLSRLRSNGLIHDSNGLISLTDVLTTV